MVPPGGGDTDRADTLQDGPTRLEGVLSMERHALSSGDLIIHVLYIHVCTLKVLCSRGKLRSAWQKAKITSRGHTQNEIMSDSIILIVDHAFVILMDSCI